MTHEMISTWTTSPDVNVTPAVGGQTVRLASAAPIPGAGTGEVALLVSLTDDRVLQAGDTIVCVDAGAHGVLLVRVQSDPVSDRAGRWTATGGVVMA
jgi:hypothetical protein